jgi:hypothetical protein
MITYKIGQMTIAEKGVVQCPDSIIKFGVIGTPGVIMKINGSTVKTNDYGIYELDLMGTGAKITSFEISHEEQPENWSLLFDYIHEVTEGGSL